MKIEVVTPQAWLDEFHVFEIAVSSVYNSEHLSKYIVEARTMADACRSACELHAMREGLIDRGYANHTPITIDDVEATAARKREDIRCIVGPRLEPSSQGNTGPP